MLVAVVLALSLLALLSVRQTSSMPPAVGSAQLCQARDGKWYTWNAFVDHYGRDRAAVMWEEAKARPYHTSRNVESELRQARDGKFYTWDEFLRNYGANR